MSRVTYGQKGYDGCSMSLRAREAYEGGEMPRSKWSKAAMIAAIQEACDDESRVYDPAIEKRTAADLFRTFFYCSSVHHTGKFARETEFYEVDRYAVKDAFQFEFRPAETKVKKAYYVRVEPVRKVIETDRAFAAVGDGYRSSTTTIYPDKRTTTCRALGALLDAERSGAAGVIVTYGSCEAPCSRGVFDIDRMKCFSGLHGPETHVWTALPNLAILPGDSWARKKLAMVCATGVLSLDGGAHYRRPSQFSEDALYRLLDYMTVSGDYLARWLMASYCDIRRVFDEMCRFSLGTVFKLGPRGRFDPQLGHTFDLTGVIDAHETF